MESAATEVVRVVEAHPFDLIGASVGIGCVRCGSGAGCDGEIPVDDRLRHLTGQHVVREAGSTALAALSRSSCAASNSTSSAPRLSDSWAGVRAPMMGEVTAGFCRVQARAVWAGVWPISAATSLTTSVICRPRAGAVDEVPSYADRVSSGDSFPGLSGTAAVNARYIAEIGHRVLIYSRYAVAVQLPRLSDFRPADRLGAGLRVCSGGLQRRTACPARGR